MLLVYAVSILTCIYVLSVYAVSILTCIYVLLVYAVSILTVTIALRGSLTLLLLACPNLKMVYVHVRRLLPNVRPYIPIVGVVGASMLALCLYYSRNMDMYTRTCTG